MNNNGSDEDLRGWDYDMIWTLFNIGDPDGTTEAKEEDCACKEKSRDGFAVSILKFLFGGTGESSDPEDCENYQEKRPYHRHIHQPATRRFRSRQPFGQDTAEKSKKNTPGAPDSEYVIRRLEAESALVPRPPMGPPGMGPEGVYPPGSRGFHSGILRILSAIITGVLIMFLSSIWTSVVGIKDFLMK